MKEYECTVKGLDFRKRHPPPLMLPVHFTKISYEKSFLGISYMLRCEAGRVDDSGAKVYFWMALEERRK